MMDDDNDPSVYVCHNVNGRMNIYKADEAWLANWIGD